MATTTDPARELTDLCEELRRHSSKSPGDIVVANAFGVEPWSTEFHQILTAICERIDEVQMIVEGTDLDADTREEMLIDLTKIKGAFGRVGLTSAWEHACNHLISKSEIAQLRPLANNIRGTFGYPKLEPSEQDELAKLVEQLIERFEVLRFSDHDFLRHALVLGLKRLHLRLEKIKWFGWGSVDSSMREIAGAQLMLEKVAPAPLGPEAEAIQGVTHLFAWFIEKTKPISDAVNRIETARKILNFGAGAIGAGALYLRYRAGSE